MKKGTGILALLLAGIVSAGALSGCAGAADTGADNAVSAPSSEQTAAGTAQTAETAGTQILNVSTTAFGNNYDVQDMGWRWMMADCYEGLYRNVADDTGEHFILAGAESVEVSEDGKKYTFHLRENAKWSDGEPVTARDYEYGWKRLLNPEYNYSYATFIYNVAGAEEYNKGTASADEVQAVAVDDYTFEVTLKEADPTFEVKLVATPLYPTRQDIAEAAGDLWGKDWTLCVYNGPFCMSGLVEDNKMVWTKNPYYWDAENTHLDTINWYIVAEEATRSTMFDNGELDLIQPSGDYAVKYREEAEAGEVWKVVYDYPGTLGLRFNFLNGGPEQLVSSAKIRKAISYAIDREEFVEAVYGRYEPAYSYVSPAISFNGSPYRSQTDEIIRQEYETYANDSDKLQALFREGLDELGIDKPLSDIKLVYLTYGSSVEAQAEREYLQQTLQNKLGVQIEINVVGDSSLFAAERDAGNYDFIYSGWYADYNDPLDFLYTYYTDAYGTSFGSYSNPEYDRLIDSLTGETDMAKRLQIYEDLEKLLLLEDYAFAPIYYSTKEVILQNWVKDYRTSSFGASSEFYITYIEGKNQ
ncbi:MAG: peptide ABC transporter substrate-binding protein [Roseburia sp.]|nr:peptide ABC transporter substrate-binding protein [Roseburia sp.]